MKPCAENKKFIAWLALDELDENVAGELRTHLNTCVGCREYWEQLSAACHEYSVLAEASTTAAASHAFHERLRTKIRKDLESSMTVRAAAFLRYWLFERYAILPITAAAIALTIVFTRYRIPRDISSTQMITVSVAPVRPDVPPTLSVYRMAANQSLEAFDELLTRQGAQGGRLGEALTMFAFREIDPEN